MLHVIDITARRHVYLDENGYTKTASGVRRKPTFSSVQFSGTTFKTTAIDLRPIDVCIKGRKEGNVLFNDALNTFYLRLFGVRHMVKDHSDSEKGNPLPPHGLLFPISSKGSFICTIPQTG